MKIILKDNVIVYIGEIAEKTEQGIVTNECIFIETDLVVKDVATIPDGVIPQKYCYTDELGFYENPNWVDPTLLEPITRAEYLKQQEVIDALVLASLEV